MKNPTIFLLIILVMTATGNTQDLSIPGARLTGDVFWRGNITVSGDVVVEKNGRLIIEPGTRVLFEANTDVSRSGSDKTRSEIIVHGALLAQGNSSKKILFSSRAGSSRMGDWYGIQFLHNDEGSRLDFCIIEYAFNGITIKNNDLQVRNSEIRYNFNSGIRTEVKAAPQIIQNLITENGYAGVVCELGSTPVLRDNLIAQNPIGMVILSLSQPNLGSLEQGPAYNPGQNRFANNEEYDIYNHSSKSISAQNNTWSTENRTELENKLYDSADNSKYGPISISPLFSERQREPNLNRLLLLAQSTNEPDNQKVDSVETGQSTNSLTQNTDEAVSDEDTIKPAVPEQIVSDTEPLLASVKPVPLNDSAVDTEEPNAETTQPAINYEQIFMEPFLDRRRKEFIRKEKFMVTGSLRQVMEPGEIRVKVVVGRDGEVESAMILKGINPMLDNAVLETVRKYRYRPGQVNGQAVRFSTNEVFRFQ